MEGQMAVYDTRELARRFRAINDVAAWDLARLRGGDVFTPQDVALMVRRLECLRTIAAEVVGNLSFMQTAGGWGDINHTLPVPLVPIFALVDRALDAYTLRAGEGRGHDRT